MIYFIDLDGVIIDSINECFEVSFQAYFGFSNVRFDRNHYKGFFNEFRCLVNPPCDYLFLHKAIEEYIENRASTIIDNFRKFRNKSNEREKELFETKFFFIRELICKNDFVSWIQMNPLSTFGKNLVNSSGDNVYIITTKNLSSTNLILSHYGINAKKVFANADIKIAGSKGNLISEEIDRAAISEAIFIDDSTEHLDSVTDTRVKCLFADWGYGKNTDYDVYDFTRRKVGEAV